MTTTTKTDAAKLKARLARSALQQISTDKRAIDSAEKRIAAQVLAARQAGATWAEIGAALGLTGQGACYRYQTLEARTRTSRRRRR